MPSFSRNSVLAILLALSFLYGVAELVPGRFVQTDEVFFKAAGRNWAMTGKFAAPEIVGRLAAGPPLTEIYFAQPPLYTFLYGVYTKLVGFGPRSSMAYDVLIHLLLIWCAVAVARAVYALPWSISVLCGALMLPLGTVGRPDELGIVFALCAAMAFQSRSRPDVAAIIGGIFLGLCAATSLGALVFLGPLVLWKPWSEAGLLTARLRWLALAAVGGLFAAMACVAPILISHPDAYQQLITHAGEQSSMLSWATGKPRNSENTFLQNWKMAIDYGSQYVVLVVGLLVFGILCWTWDKARSWTRYSAFVVAALSIVALVAFIPGKYFYLWFALTWLVTLCAALAAEVLPSVSPRRQAVLLVFAALAWVVTAAPYLRWKAILWTLPSNQSLSVSTRQIRAEIPAGAGVVSSDYWWALADRDQVYDVMFSNPDADAVDFVAASGNGSGKPGTPLGISPKYRDADFQVLSDHLNTAPASILGIRLSHSSYGFGAYVLKREHREAATPASELHMLSR